MMRQPLFGRWIFFTYTLAAVISGALFVSARSAAAATILRQRATEIQVGASTQRIPIFTPKFRGGASIALADMNGDGSPDYVVAAGPGGGPAIEVYDRAGNMLSSFYAFDKTVRTGLFVAAGNVNGDGSSQIVVSQQAGGNSEIRVFDFHGTLLRKFTAFESGYAGGVHVGVISGHNGSGGYILAGSGLGREMEARVYSASGGQVVATFSPFGKNPGNGVTVAGGWSDAYADNLVILGATQGGQPDVQVWSLSAKTKLTNWLAYPKTVTTGVNIGYANDAVVTAPAYGGGPDVKVFSLTGQLQNEVLMFENAFRGGVQVALITLDGLTLPVAVPMSWGGSGNNQGKKIVVSLSKQTLTMYQDGQIVSIRRVSTGKWSTPTPPGTYQTYNKIPNAYSRAYGLYMEWWMAFTPDGSMGLHALPYWKLKNGGKLYEGAAHIGTPVSHGCVRQTLAEAKSLYDWTPIGTPVIIER